MSATFEYITESIINQINNPKNFNGKFVYFMSSPSNNLIKIGISNNPYNRKKTVNNSVPFDVDLLAFFPGNFFFERILELSHIIKHKSVFAKLGFY